MLTPSLLGVVLALVMYVVSVSPSLLPRTWWWHAAASGVLMLLGYLVGLVVEKAGARVMHAADLHITVSPLVEHWYRQVLVGLFLLWFLRATVISFRDARRAASLVEMRAESWRGYLLGAFGALVVAYVLGSFVGALLWVGRLIVEGLGHWMPHAVAVVLAAAAVGLFVFLLTSRVLLRGIISFFSRHAWKMNRRTARGIHRPTQPERSGSPESASSWESVGGQGRVFLGRGPRREDIEAVTGRPAREPIRVYAGMPETREGLADRAQLVVDELRRTGAFERALVVVTTSTGSGWVDEWQVQPLEYLVLGDCATASMQYSYVPSSINFLQGLDLSVEAARLLFHAVRDAIDALPEGLPRPSLFVCGESLGAYASQEVFDDLDDVLAQVSGALWVGTPAFTPLHARLTAARHTGSPEVAPVVDNAHHVRFTNIPADLRADVYGRELGPWGHPRIVYAQHPSDPVVWWNTAMVWHQPDWLREKAGRDVSPRMQYTRIATFIQVLADMPLAGIAPAGHGHTYHEELIPLWEGILGLHEPDEPDLDLGFPSVLGGTHPDLPADPGLSDVGRDPAGARGTRVEGLDGAWITEDMRARIGHAIAANIALSDRQ